MKLAFIGGGNMASAIINGIISSGFITPADITVSDSMPEKLSAFSEKGINITSDNLLAADSADVIIFAVKPNILREILSDFSIFNNKLFISIAAGVSVAELKKGIGGKSKAIRVMPNTPALVGEGMTVICQSNAGEKNMDIAVKIFGTVGKTLILDEKYIDAVTAVSGSGPAYIYMVIEAMADGGVLCGLPRDVAYMLAAQTVLGSAKTVLQSGEHPGVLKDRVCSPGGTTIEAVYSLEQSDIRGAFIEAVKKCADKSKSM
ncbi:MAG: pyrroline-5-carboxylate reductase [Monoglobales bacterium]